MKGIIFSELFDLVESTAGYEVVDKIISNCELTNNGAYTTIGTYDFGELAQLVGQLSLELDVPANALIKMFGKHLFSRFASKFSELYRYADSFSMLRNVEDIIHVEVCKIYPQAELPTFTYKEVDENTLEMTYKSIRPLADLCEGLIEGCIEHFDENVEIVRKDLTEDATSAQFRLKRTPTQATV